MRAMSTLWVVASFGGEAQAVIHMLIVGTFGTNSLYSLEFEDVALTLEMTANTPVPVSSSWIALSSEIPGFVSYSVADATTITHDATVAAGGNCTGSAIYVTAAQKSSFAVYDSFFGDSAGCGTVMSVDKAGSMVDVLQNYTYNTESGIHGVALRPDEAFLYSADDGGNALWTHQVDQTAGAVSYVASVEGPSIGSDSRHVAVHPNGKMLYLLLEGSNEVAQYKIDGTTGIPTFTNVTYPLIMDGADDADYWSDEAQGSNSTSAGSTGYISAFSLDDDGAIMKRLFLTPTTTGRGAANAVTPSGFSDEFVALTDSSVGFVEIWRFNGSAAEVIAHLDLNDGGCCANAVWYS